MTRSLPHILRYLFKLLRGHRLQVTLNILAGVVLVGLDLAFVWATKLAIDIATEHSCALPLRFAFGLIAAIMLSRIAITVALRWVRAVLGVRAQNSMRRHVFARLLQSQWGALRCYHTGNLTNRMERDVTDVVNFVTESIPSLVTTCVQFIGAFFFLFFMDRTLAVIVVCVIPFFLLSSKLYVRTMRRLSHRVRDEESGIQSIIQETLQHALVVKTLDRVRYFIELLSDRQQHLHGTVLTRTRYSTLSLGILNLGFATGYFVTFAWGATQLAAGAISYGAMLAFIQLVSQIQNPVRNLSRFIPVFISSFTAAERLMDLEEIPLEQSEGAKPLQAPVGLHLEHVSFRYTPESRWIQQDFSYSFPAGSVTAIVGETGAGKTTLIRLLLSLITPLEGKVSFVDGEGKVIPITPEYRKNFAYVPQGNSLISGTIRSNLLLGNPDATDEQLREALEIAAADFVFRKPAGLDSPCGETGDGLSEGQAQRIAIARALLSSGNIFIFDEATSSLDAETERIVLQRIVAHYPHHTFIFITHRPEVLKYATQVLELKRMKKK